MLNNDNYLIEAIEVDRMQDESADQIMSYLTTSSYESAETFLMSDRICDHEQFMIDIGAFARTIACLQEAPLRVKVCCLNVSEKVL